MNKQTIKLLAFGGLIAGLAIHVPAQNAAPAPPGTNALSKVGGALKLSPEQQAKVKALDLEFAPKWVAISTNQTLSSAEKQEKLKPIEAERMKRMQKILTPEQWTKYQSRQEAIRARLHPVGDAPWVFGKIQKTNVVTGRVAPDTNAGKGP